MKRNYLKRNFALLFIVITLMLTYQCKKENESAVPSITTTTITSITETTAESGGTINDNGGKPITSCGVCWGKVPNPTTSDNMLINSPIGSSFVSLITGLTPNTTYYVRSYAINDVGIAYGNELFFKTTERKGIPVVSTSTAWNITPYSAICGGYVSKDSGSVVTSCGVCWDISPKPTILKSHTINGGGIGSFTAELTGLYSNRKYYVRAYGINSIGISYGDEITFSTPFVAGNFTDIRDGQDYETIQIGNQIWMAENLNYRISPNSVYYNFDSIHYSNYGRLYSYSEASNACPSGWHLPSNSEVITMMEYLGLSSGSSDFISDTILYPLLIEGGQTKFNALFGGSYDDASHEFKQIGVDAMWWTNTVYIYDSYNSGHYLFYVQKFSAGGGKAGTAWGSRGYHSIRCTKN